LRFLPASLGLVILAAIIYNAAVVDRLPPTYVIRVSSTAAGGRALTLTAIDVDFSKDVKPETAEKAFSISPNVDYAFHWQGNKLIVTPSAKLPLSTVFHVHMAAGVEDKAGNTQGGTGDMTFTTVDAPKVSAVSPLQGAQSVPLESPIQITFDRLMDPQKVIAGIRVEPNFTYQVSWSEAVLTLTPSLPLASDTEYKITIGDPAVDTDGSRLPDYATSFRTLGIGLRVTARVPAPDVAGMNIHSQIAVVFDGPIDPASVDGAIKLTPPVSGSTKVVSLPDDRNPPASPTATPEATPTGPGANVLVFTPDNPLAAHTTYSVTMSSAVRGTNGQAAPQQAWSFITGESTLNALNQIAFLSDRGGVTNVWLMNPDGTNPRQVTWELARVSGFDVSGDGSTIAYGAGGVVRKMSIGGDGLQTLTASTDLEYAPTFTPDGTGLIVGRRDGTGADLGYWRIPMITGTDPKQVTTDGAPNLGSTGVTGDGLTGKPGLSAWESRAAFSPDGSTMLIVRGSDSVAMLVDMTGATPPRTLNIVGDSEPVWVQSDAAFYVVGTADGGATWLYWRVTGDGVATSIGPAVSDIDTAGETAGQTAGQAIALIVRAGDGSIHLAYSARPGGPLEPLTNDPAYSEMSPSFRPDGQMVVFGRVRSQAPTLSAGIWIVKPDGTGLTNLSLDGTFPRWLP
jgi:Tol biopolymer transport system component